jgi:hypothetical protein
LASALPVPRCWPGSSSHPCVNRAGSTDAPEQSGPRVDRLTRARFDHGQLPIRALAARHHSPVRTRITPCRSEPRWPAGCMLP